MTSCDYRSTFYITETLTCEFGCCEHGCCSDEQMKEQLKNNLSKGEIAACVLAPFTFVVVLYFVVFLCRRWNMNRQAAILRNLIEASNRRPHLDLNVTGVNIQPSAPASPPPLYTQEPEVPSPPPAYTQVAMDNQYTQSEPTLDTNGPHNFRGARFADPNRYRRLSEDM
ncbi:hypothetical protein MAR_020861 [Mya arenaria]|uniref:Vesicular, overexpressed in cancer, prosurvival protein 1 n=1 Tax=Mya arenaria TaxID=6604 RepID=A0ABY7E959_MYAAR|nr:uncharacterized protein LOC128234302 [Mya arenaria]WAR05492.1 hypothetical protein MAR_020861 [Mya arenaria]